MKKDDPFWVQLDEVPAAGLTVEATLSKQWQTAALGTAHEPTEKRPVLRFTATRNQDQLAVAGSVEIEGRFECSRCAETCSRTLCFPVSILFLPAGRTGIAPVDDEDIILADPDVQMCEYEADAFSIELPFVEAVVMGVPPYPVCDDACKGLCPVCGANLNHEKCACPASVPGPRWAPLAKLGEAKVKSGRSRTGG